MLQPLLEQVAVPFGALAQTAPQAPQLLASLRVSIHLAPQRMNGSVHWKPHVPVQTGVALAGALQAVPHFPQFDVSLPRFTQEPLQLVCDPHSVVQAPALHTVPAVHTVVQSPQCFESD